jgi:primary-amine oxidase
VRICFLAIGLVLGAPVYAQSHPLDGLTSDELVRSVMVLRAGKQLTTGKVASVTLQEPAKADVLKWSGPKLLPRRAQVRALQAERAYEGIVNLDSGKVESWAVVPGAQPSFLLSEFFGATEIVKRDAGWRTAMAKRGYTNFDNIICNPLAAGYLPDPQDRTKRLMNVPCFDGAGARNNVFARPIEGLLAVVDLSAGKVEHLVDMGVVPVPTDMPQHDYASQNRYRKPFKPVVMAAPAGDNISMNGGMVAWDNWSFHLRMDRRVGPVISLVRWDDRGKARSIAYQMSASEMFVPYMDRDPTWSFKSYLDAGEYGLGLLSSPLAPGRDCPDTARFIDAVFNDDDGRPLKIERAVCLFERNTGDPIWRHTDAFTQSAESRPGVQLVARSVAVIGNYDYILDFVFSQSGEIEVRVGATGIDAVKGVEAQRMSDASAAKATEVGTLIAPGLVGINHDHYVNFRLDLDIDEPDNAGVVLSIQPTRIDGNPGRTSMWQVAAKKQTMSGPVDLRNDGFLTIQSHETTSLLGHHPSYELLGGHSVTSILSPDDPVQARANFSSNLTWLTTYDQGQRYAAGEWPNQSGPNEGLPAYAEAKPELGDDLVVWQTVGFRHVTRAEDWPIMPTLWHSFLLRPRNFFDRSPAMDVAPGFQE